MPKFIAPLAIVLVSAGFFFAQAQFEGTPEIQAIPAITIENAPQPGSEVSYEFMATQSGTVALELVQQLAAVETKDFGAAGQFITGINGLAADDGHYWGFYLNGQSAQLGVSQTVLSEGDIIHFTYEEISATQP